MLISGREAVRILLKCGGMTGEAQARALLRTGAAGWGTVTDTGVYFQSEDVIALADRPWLSRSAQEDACPHGAYLARVSRSVTLDLTRPWTEVAASLAGVPTMPTMTSALLTASVTAQPSGGLPWVATLHGFVVLGADLVGLATDAEGVNTFELQPPGDWFDAWHETRIRVTRGGRPWVIRRARAG